jgi:hypothetical protein
MLARTGMAVEKGTKTVISMNFGVFVEREINNVPAGFSH